MQTELTKKNAFINYTGWALQIISAVIMLQTLFFKFTASPESVYIFSTLGAEPFGRIFSGIVELIASVLLLTRSWSWLGAGIAAGTMFGALIAHLTILGIVVMNDGGELFLLGCIVFVSSIIILLIRRKNINIFGFRFS